MLIQFYGMIGCGNVMPGLVCYYIYDAGLIIFKGLTKLFVGFYILLLLKIYQI